MGAKRTILWASAITLIGVGVFLRRQAASPALSSVGGAVPATGRHHASSSPRLFSQASDQARLPFTPLEEDVESVRQLAERDPPAAATQAIRLPAGSVRVDAMKAVAIAWANQDLPGAVEWGRRLTDESEREMALTCIGFEAARSDPSTALTVAAELDASSERDELIGHAAGEWAVTAPDAAAEWARQIEDGPLRSRALAAIAVAWAEADPWAAGKLASEELGPGRIQEDAVVSIVQRWAQQQPADAGVWLKGLLPGSIRSVGIAAYEEQVAPAFGF